MACIHQWEVAGTDFPVIRCQKCNAKWIGMSIPEAFQNADAFDVLCDCIKEYEMGDPNTRVQHLTKARLIWQTWTRKRNPSVDV